VSKSTSVYELTNQELRLKIAELLPEWDEFTWDENGRILCDSVFPMYIPNWPEDIESVFRDLAKKECFRYIFWSDIFKEWFVTTESWEEYRNPSLPRLISEVFVMEMTK